MIVEKTEWKVQSENSKEHKKLWEEMIAQQRAERDRWFYTISRFYSSVENDIENWMYCDEYDSEDSYQKGQTALQEMMEIEEFKHFSDKLLSLIVENSMITTTWTELEDLRVD